MTQEKLERMKASIKEAAEKRKALKEAGEMPLVNEAPTPVVNDPIADPAPVEAAPAEPAATPESFTPPAPGMVPSGWVRPEDLASVVTAAQDEQDATAQVTGDVEAAQSVEVPTTPAGSEIAAPTAEPTPVMESMLPKDGERKTPVSAEEEVAQEEELAKKKMKESEEEDEDEEVDEEEADDEDAEEDTEEEDDDEIPGEVEGDDEVVNDEDVDEVKDYFDPPAECDDCEDGEGFELVSDGDQMQADVLALTSGIEGEEDEEGEEEEIPSAEEIFDNSNFLDKLEAFFDNKDSEDVADLAAALHDSADFLDYLIGGSDEEEVEDDEEEFEESSGRIPFKKSECDEPKHKDIRARIAKHRAMHEAVKYPAGSEPEASQIANTRRQQQVEEENLVRTYEEKLQARKDALRKVRENIKRTRNVNAAAEAYGESEHPDKFKEAIRGRFNEENAPRKKTDSWEDNKFIDKYTERQKLNFRDLLNDGTITNLLG